MAWRVERDTGDIVFDGFEQGVAPSPHKGIANIQGGNISTESGEVMASFNRTAQTLPTATNATLTPVSTTLFTSSVSLNVGQWINVSSATTKQIPANKQVTAKVLAVGGGGGGGSSNNNLEGAGGGGGGDVVENDSVTLGISAYTVTVDAGGAAGTSGGSSSLAALVTAAGGGHGGAAATAGANGSSGGGGGGINTSGTPLAGGTGSGTNGHNGGAGGATSSGIASGGGGGGAGTIGSAGSTASGGGAIQANGGAGGNGFASSISGSSVTYGGGGGGAGVQNNGVGTGSGGAGGTGGGGAGGSCVNGTTGSGTAGTANTGGGGGGGNVGGAGGSGVVIISVPTGYITATGGTKTTVGGNDIWTFNSSGTFTVTAINAYQTMSGDYYVSYKNGSDYKLSFYYDPTASASIVTTDDSGTATFSTTPNMSSPVAGTIETYYDGTNSQSRYYILDNAGLVWVYDTANEGTTGLTWFLPDKSTSYYSNAAPSGLAVLNGALVVFAGNAPYFKLTAELGDTTSNNTVYQELQTPSIYTSDANKTNNHPAFAGHQGRIYYGDGAFVGSIFPDTSIVSGNPNIQSYCKYTAVTTAGTIAPVITGSVPIQFDSSGTTLRVPVVMVAAPGGTLPSGITDSSTVYWIQAASSNAFGVYSAQTGGSAIDIQTGAVGNQYFTTFYPTGTDGLKQVTASNERVNLPPFEQVTALAEVGNILLIGCKGNVVYPWNQIDVTPSSIISLPEGDVAQILTVHQMAYIFAGHKGNIYITDGSVASLVLKVPDYCAGIPGSPATYVEPYYSWGGVAYIRGRIYFSMLDQTSTKGGNCGGIWSFIPTQNFYIGQDVGQALRLENQNSYGTYNGVATVILPRFDQSKGNPLFWTGWYSDVTSPTYGIDYSNTGTSASFPVVIDLDALPTGTFLKKRTFKQIEYKLASPLDAGATVAASYRKDLTGTFTSLGTAQTESNGLSGVFPSDFEFTQWLQLQVTLTPITSTASTNTFVRLKEIRLR